jgi:hypothetical protein
MRRFYGTGRLPFAGMIGNRVRRRAMAVVALAGMALAVASCSSGPAHTRGSAGSSAGSAALPPDTRLKLAGVRVLSRIGAYSLTTRHCPTQPSPVVCVEAADRTLGGQVHTYANLLAVGRGFHAPANALTAARNSAQTLANSLEILGDAQPTQSNYNQVLNTFDLNGALEQLKSAVATLNAHS